MCEAHAYIMSFSGGPISKPQATTGALKQIRFISSDGPPHVKRRRITAACQTCRKRKTRCSGERPACKTCTDSNQECGGYASEQNVQSTGAAGLANAEDSKRNNHDWESGERHVRGKSSSSYPAQQSTSPELRRGRKDTDGFAGSTGWDGPLLMKHPTTHGFNRQYLSNPVVAEDAAEGQFEDGASTLANDSGLLSLATRNRMPYFRYFGPTAIMPGFKQMVVQLREHRLSTGRSSSAAVESPGARFPSLQGSAPGGQRAGSNDPINEIQPPEIPFYDTSPLPPSPLITQLCETFFTHLSCNFPFLQRERFMRDLMEKEVDAILVDSVCALAARFLKHPQLLSSLRAEGAKVAEGKGPSPADCGQAFARRAQSAIVEVFHCPSVAVVQASLLLAYQEFGSNRDSGLWMYLGISIRMAQDLGMQKLEGLKFEGRSGRTPKSVKRGEESCEQVLKREALLRSSSTNVSHDEDTEEQRSIERERVDTFWAVFFLDRAVSSGTGRPVTLRDKDIELSFPSLDLTDSITGWPLPYPALIRIIHLYGRVADLLNNIREAKQVTSDTIKRLAAMENDLTAIYQGLSSKLHFNALNFQHYVRAGEGTTFVLLHFWFHTLIVILHQPTLLHSFEGEIQHLFPNSRELSMSSAKTISDIVSFAELIDAKACLGNPFTTYV